MGFGNFALKPSYNVYKSNQRQQHNLCTLTTATLQPKYIYIYICTLNSIHRSSLYLPWNVSIISCYKVNPSSQDMSLNSELIKIFNREKKTQQVGKHLFVKETKFFFC